MIKAIFFDIDGTLLSHKLGRVQQSSKQAIIQLREKGIRVFMATGRHILEIEELPLDEIETDGYVTLNGQLCLGEGREVFYELPVDDEDVQTIITIFNEKKIPVQVIEKDRMYMNIINEKVRKVQEEICSEVSPPGEYKGDKIYQFVIYVDDKETEQIVRSLSGSKMSRWNRHAIDIIPKKGGKVEGIKQILKLYDIAPDEIMAFGDGENDIDMLRFAGIGIAMGNAEEKVKCHADYVTDTVEGDGIIKALRHYNILDAPVRLTVSEV